MENDINVRKAPPWKSSQQRSIKIMLFIATMESILLRGSESWTLTKKPDKKLDGMYT